MVDEEQKEQREKAIAAERKNEEIKKTKHEEKAKMDVVRLFEADEPKMQKKGAKKKRQKERKREKNQE